jgi:Ca2+-transporting ATPase
MKIYNKNLQLVLNEFAASENGLSQQEAELRISRFGKNLILIKGVPWYKKLVEPFKSVFMLILFVAATISFIKGQTVDTIIIGAIICINAVIYYFQTISTERVLKSLKRHDKQLVLVLRNEKSLHIDSEYLVPGDVIILNEGQKIPADCRIIHTENLRCDEALLTGESKPVSKQVHHLNSEKELYEQTNMLFQGTFVVSGTAKALVIATGNSTEFGQLAKLSAQTQPISPVQAKIDKLLSYIIFAVAIVATMAFILSLFRGFELSESIRYVLSLTVSAVPESLPVAVSVILALGMSRMAKKKALVRSMPAIENVGTLTLIATDKTGTLTKNKLSVQDVWQIDEKDLVDTCKIIKYTINSKNGVMHDPLDHALNSFASKYYKQEIDEPVNVLPFELSYAMSGNVYKNQGKYEVFIKGAPEKVIDKCTLNSEEKIQVHQALLKLTSMGYRVIAISKTEINKPLVHFRDLKKGMEFVALVAVADELRKESVKAISQAIGAGVKVCMITGDHFETAYAIGKKLGLVHSRHQVLDSREMAKYSDAKLKELVKTVRVFARVTPENKYRLLEVFKKTEITAMTGDGVNDVPALVNAHVGFAMGSGSQIAKDAGDIVLLDDNFRSIITSLKEGRKIYDNIRRLLFYLLSTNLGEVLISITALALGMPLPLLAVQILWVNLVTDSCLAIPLGLESSEPDVLNRPPRRANKPVLGRRSIARLLIISLSMASIALITYSVFLQNYSEEYARSIVFTVIVVMQWANAFNARSERQSAIKRLKTINVAFIIGLSIAILLQFMVIYGPLGKALHVIPVGAKDLFIPAAIAFVLILLVDEIFKIIYKYKDKAVVNTNKPIEIHSK